LRIGERSIDSIEKPYIIAEIGVNHDGSVDRALELVELAVEAGADAVKVQYFEADRLLSGAARLAAYQRESGASDPFDLLRALELSIDDMAEIVARAHRLNLHAIVTPFSVEHVGSIGALAWDAFKTASPDIVNRPLIDAITRLGRPMIVSTGAADEDEVRRAIGWLACACDRLALLQCVSAYPTKDTDAALGGVSALREMFDGPVGYSDHTTATDTGALAVAAGAIVLEKHITDDRNAPGPDHAASLEPRSFAEYVRLARRAHVMLGPREKRVLEAERDVRNVSRQSVVAARDIRAGELITREALTIRRPGGGVEPWRLNEVVGKVAARRIACDEVIHAADLREAPVTAGLA